MKDFLTIAFARILQGIRGRGLPDDGSADALQDAFCNLWGRKYGISDSRHAENLLRTATRNIRIDSFRSGAAHRSVGIDDIAEISDYASDYAEDIGMDDMIADVERIISRELSVREREILIMRDRNGWEFDELAVKFSTSEANVRMILSRARKKVRYIYRMQNRIK